MNAFLTELDVTPLADGRNWKLLGDLVYCSDLSSQGDILRIPSGFITDFASIPRLFWNIFPPFGEYTAASVVHDYGYRNGGVYPGAKFIYSKAQVDGIFRDAMKLCGVGWFTRTIMYQAVRHFGRGNFEALQ